MTPEDEAAWEEIVRQFKPEPVVRQFKPRFYPGTERSEDWTEGPAASPDMTIEWAGWRNEQALEEFERPHVHVSFLNPPRRQRRPLLGPEGRFWLGYLL